MSDKPGPIGTVTLSDAKGFKIGDVITFSQAPTRWQAFLIWLCSKFDLEAKLKPKLLRCTAVSSNCIMVDRYE